jgi:hypothetical protein
MVWFEMLLALTAIVALDLANGVRPVVVKRRGKSHGVLENRGGRDGHTRSTRTHRA